MSIFDEMDKRLLEKKEAFLNEVRNNFSKEERLTYGKIQRKILETSRQIWKNERRVSELELDVKENNRALKKFRNIFIAAILGLVVIHYFKSGSEVDLGFTTLAFGGIFGLGVLYFRTAEIAALTEISNIKITNSILRSNLFEFDLYHFSNPDDYIRITEESGYNPKNLTEDEIKKIGEFNMDLSFVIVRNMGYEIPVFWD